MGKNFTLSRRIIIFGEIKMRCCCNTYIGRKRSKVYSTSKRFVRNYDFATLIRLSVINNELEVEE
jgi:hypothetical protein